MVVPLRTFDSVSTVTEVAPGRFIADLDLDWTIAGKPNGGYLLAILARAARTDGPHQHPLALSAHYLRSPSPGRVDIEVEVLRAGRSASQVRARLRQDGQGCIEALFTTGTVLGGTDVHWTRLAPPDITAFENCVPLPAVSPLGFEARIMTQVGVRLDPVTLGFARNQPSGLGELRGWLSLPGDLPFDPFSLVFAGDAFPPASFEVAASGWAPTLELTVYVRALPAPGPLRVVQRVQVIADERMDEVCYLWDSTGRLVAQATQLAGIRLL
jgi:acyl-coenzyme A thioesterase PaaI-like protein